MTLDCTVSTEFKRTKNGYSGLKKHNEHDPKLNHSNKNIDPLRREFNLVRDDDKYRKTVDDFNEEMFGDFVKQHDMRQEETGHPDQVYGTVKNYTKRHDKRTCVITIGNVETQSKLMRAVCPSDVLVTAQSPEGYSYTTFDLKPREGAENDPQEQARLKRVKAEASKFYGCYARVFKTMYDKQDKLHGGAFFGKHLKLGRNAMHVDEGAIHWHAEVAACGMTKGGKKRGPHATQSLNQALIGAYMDAHDGHGTSGKKATRWFREAFDPYVLGLVNQALQQEYGLDEPPLSFHRKTHDDPALKTGQDMETYKKQQRAVTASGERLESLEKQLDELQEKYDKLHDKYTGWDRNRGMVEGAETESVNDFVDCVFENISDLNTLHRINRNGGDYRTDEKGKNVRDRLKQRLRDRALRQERERKAAVAAALAEEHEPAKQKKSKKVQKNAGPEL